MTFNELIDIRPNIRLADLIQLFLLGKDDKIYFDICLDYGEDNLFSHIRIIDSALTPFYEYKVEWIEESDWDSTSIFSVKLLKEN